MLKIIMGVEQVDKYIDTSKFVEFPNYFFNDNKKKEWFSTDFAKRLISEIDRSSIIADFAVFSNVTNTGYSVNDLSGGSKCLMLIYNEPDYIYRLVMGDNCVEFLEEAAKKYEEQGKDLILVSNKIYYFKFKHIDEVHFVNWNITCRSNKEISSNVWNLWFKQERALLPNQRDLEGWGDLDFDELIARGRD